MTQSVKDLLSGAKTPGYFQATDAIGRTTGWVEVLEVSVFEQTDIKTGETLRWKNGNPQMAISAKVATTPEPTMIYFTGHKFKMLQEATDDLRAGDQINVTYLGESDRAKRPGFNAAKLYKVEVKAGSAPASTVAKPDSVPQSLWDRMSASEQAEMVGSLGSTP